MHEQMAAKAKLDGKTSAEFYAAAQKHANATWIWVIVGGVVWYFAGWGWALLPFAVAIFTMFQSFSATAIANNMRKYEGGS